MAKSQEIVPSLRPCVRAANRYAMSPGLCVCKRIVAIIISSVETTAAAAAAVAAASYVQRATRCQRVSPSSLTFMWHLKSICTTIEFSPFLSAICYCECLSLLFLLLLLQRYDTDSLTDRQTGRRKDRQTDRQTTRPDDAFTCQLAIYAQFCSFYPLQFAESEYLIGPPQCIHCHSGSALTAHSLHRLTCQTIAAKTTPQMATLTHSLSTCNML